MAKIWDVPFFLCFFVFLLISICKLFIKIHITKNEVECVANTHMLKVVQLFVWHFLYSLVITVLQKLNVNFYINPNMIRIRILMTDLKEGLTKYELATECYSLSLNKHNMSTYSRLACSSTSGWSRRSWWGRWCWRSVDDSGSIPWWCAFASAWPTPTSTSSPSIMNSSPTGSLTRTQR